MELISKVLSSGMLANCQYGFDMTALQCVLQANVPDVVSNSVCLV